MANVAMVRFALVTACVLISPLGSAQAQEKPKAKAVSPAVTNGSKVQIEYTLKDDAGILVDTNKGKDPLGYTQGQGQIILGLERALAGMHPGDEKQVSLKPEDGYGQPDPKAQAEVPRESIPPEALKVGAQLMARSPQGGARPVRIMEVREKTVLLDLNHPLAGKTLHFQVKILNVEAPAK